MLEELKNIKSSNKDIRSFSNVFGVIFSFISILLYYYSNFYYSWTIYFALSFFILGHLVPFVLKPVYFIWMIFAILLGWFMTRVILSILFIVVLTPIALLSRALGEDFLSLKNENNKSYWNFRNSAHEKSQNYEKQY